MSSPAHLKPAFSIGQTVYPRCCPYQYPRIITGLVIRENDRISFLASNDDCEREYQDYELSDKKLLV